MIPDARAGGQNAGRGTGRSVGPLVRVLDTIAGLLSAGVLVLGILLLIAQLIAPLALSLAGWGDANGPGWWQVVTQLVVGGAGEVVVRMRHGWAGPVRAAADVTVIMAIVLVLAWAWWP